MTEVEFIKFLAKSLNTVSVDFVGISLIILKREKYLENFIRLYPYYDDKKIKGTIWFEKE